MEVKARYNKKYEKKNAAGQTTQSQLYSYLDRCCDILRGPINQDEFKVYITPLLFYKRLSDVYDERHDELLAVSDGDEEFASFDFNYDFRIPKGCHWKDVRAVSEDVGSAIIHSLMEIERANPNSLTGLFTSFDEADWTDKNKFSDERLKNLVEHMSSLNLGNKAYDADVMGDAYEYMIKKFADLSKKTAGEFYTPRAVVKLLVKILDPKPGETVYDPACGTGGMLIEAIRHINNDVETYRRIYGQEKNLINSAIASMNLYLHGAKEFIIRKGDTLRSPLFVKDGKLQRFDCVIANPPFSLKKWGADEFASDKYGRNIWGCPQDTNGDYAWVQHMVSSMDEKTGRLCVILSQGALSRGNREGEIRRKMIESDKVECVIALKDHLFYGSGIPAAVYVLNNNKPASHRGKICFIDASGIYTPQRAQNILSDEDVDAIYGHFIAYKDVIDVVKVASLPEGSHWKDVRSVSENVGEALVSAFRSIERANPDKLSGIFGSAAWTNKKRLSDSLLKNLIEHFSSQTLSLARCPEDELGHGYEYLIKKFADDSGHTAQEFYTNRTVVHLMTEILQPNEGESVYDPTCGSAGMLISCVHYVKEHGRDARTLAVYGQEFNSLTASIARMNLFLHGVKEFEIIQEDTLLHPGFIENGELKRFNVVLANPPYSISEWNHEAFASDRYGRNFLGVPPQGRADYAFIQHILKSLDEKNGRCAILLPHGVLRRRDEKEIRTKLVEFDLVDTVLGLGKNLFYNSPMEACILICNTNKPADKRGKVMFIDGRRFVEKNRSESYLTESQINELGRVYSEFKNVTGISNVATISEIAEKDFSLSISLYVKQDGKIQQTSDESSIEDAIIEWERSSANLHDHFLQLKAVISQEDKL